MASLQTIREGLAAALTTAGFDNVSAYTLASPTPPCLEIDVADDGVDYDLAFVRGLDQVTMTVRVILGDSSDISAQVARDTYIDGSASTDVKTALEADVTLGGAAQSLRVSGMAPRRWKSDTTGNILVGCEWTVIVYA